jgi:hypothetical protein
MKYNICVLQQNSPLQVVPLQQKKSQQKRKIVKLIFFYFPSIIYTLSTTKSICSTAANKLTTNLFKMIETKLLDVCSIIHVILKEWHHLFATFEISKEHRENPR